MAKKPTTPNKPRFVRGSTSKAAKNAPPQRTKVPKQDQVLALLRRPNGASVLQPVGSNDSLQTASTAPSARRQAASMQSSPSAAIARTTLGSPIRGQS